MGDIICEQLLSKDCQKPKSFFIQRLSPRFLEAVPFVKKEPLYVTMGVTGGDLLGVTGGGSKEDPIEDSRIKEAKNVATRNHHPHVREANNNSDDAKQQMQSKTRKKEAKSVQIARETIARRVEESKYVGVCKRFPLRDTKGFPLRDTTRKANAVQDGNGEESADVASRSTRRSRIECKQNGQDTVHLLAASRDCDPVQRHNNEEMNDNITNANGFHHLQTKAEVNDSKVSLFNLGERQLSDAEMKGKEGEVNCANASEAGGGAGAGGMENAGEGQELTQQDGAGKRDGINEEEEEDEAGRVKSDGGNERRKGAGHSPHQNNPTKGLAAREFKQNSCNGRDNSGLSESNIIGPFLAQFEALEREDQVGHNCTNIIFSN